MEEPLYCLFFYYNSTLLECLTSSFHSQHKLGMAQLSLIIPDKAGQSRIKLILRNILNLRPIWVTVDLH